MANQPLANLVRVHIQSLAGSMKGHDAHAFPVDPLQCGNPLSRKILMPSELACQQVGGAPQHHRADASPATLDLVAVQFIQRFVYPPLGERAGFLVCHFFG